MKNKVILIIFGILVSLSASAAPFGVYDARSAGMGGTGVAISQMSNAQFYNPAMLAAPSGDGNFQLTLPTLGAQVYAKERTLDGIDDFNNAIDSGDTAAANEAFNRISGDPVAVNMNGALALGFSAYDFNMSIAYNQYGTFGATINGTDSSDATFDAVGYKVEESGISFALPVEGIAAGVTVKTQSVSSYDYSQTLASTDSDEGDLIDEQGEKGHGTDVNFDLGAAYQWDNGFSVGMVIRNMLENSYVTTNNRTVDIERQYRVGAGYRNEWFTWGIDYDLKKNDPVGFEEPTQMLSTGIEFDAFGWGQFRLGLQDNQASGAEQDTAYTAGLGITPFGVGLDLAVQKSNDMLGAYLQIGASF